MSHLTNSAESVHGSQKLDNEIEMIPPTNYFELDTKRNQHVGDDTIVSRNLHRGGASSIEKNLTTTHQTQFAY